MHDWVWGQVPTASPAHTAKPRALKAAQAGLVLGLSPNSFSVHPWLLDAVPAGSFGVTVIR